MIPAMMNMTMMIIIKTTIISDYLKTSLIFQFFLLLLLFVFYERVKSVDSNLKKFWQQTSVST